MERTAFLAGRATIATLAFTAIAIEPSNSRADDSRAASQTQAIAQVGKPQRPPPAQKFDNAEIETQRLTATAQPEESQVAPETEGRAVEGNVIQRNVMFVTNDSGGLLADYAVRVAEARKSKTNVVISGRCQSACTIYTALVPDRLACAMPGTTLEFHKARDRVGLSTEALDELFLGFLSDDVSQYITRHGGLPASGFKVVAAARFVPPCVRP
jgi:hypothetical protein